MVKSVGCIFGVMVYSDRVMVYSVGYRVKSVGCMV
jgi:hypothetical protein